MTDLTKPGQPGKTRTGKARFVLYAVVLLALLAGLLWLRQETERLAVQDTAAIQAEVKKRQEEKAQPGLGL